ncbi:MAG: GH116 family glycosyl hydrolase [Candidatus Neomarinimicrobiota bacterium]
MQKIAASARIPKLILGFSLLAWLYPQIAASEMKGLVPAFQLESNDMALERRAQAFAPFDKVGRRFAILGLESGTFEAWGYPLKILRNFEFSFLIGSSTGKISGWEIARWISVTPEATVITYTHQSFVVRAIFITPVNEPGAIILLDIDSIEPMTVVASFLPVLQPMWPGGIGGQSAWWDNDLKAYIISELRHQNVGYVGSPAAAGISYTPAHMLSDHPMEFRIEVNPEEVAGKYIPIVLAGGTGDAEDFLAVYVRLANDPESYYKRNRAHFKQLRESTVHITTPVNDVNLAFEWAKVSYDNLIVTNPNLGTGLVAGLGISGTSGRPGFGWYFGGDAFINSLALTSYGAYAAVKDVLRFNQKWQRDDGKMAHELSQSAFAYVAWFEDYPYGYIHGDTTPWYLVASGDYFRTTGDLEFIQESWPSLMRAYQWCLGTDQNGDGLMDNKGAGLGALEYGPLTDILTDIYLAGIWVKALESMGYLAAAMEDDDLEADCQRRYRQAVAVLNKQFWDRKHQYFTYAFNSSGKQVPGVTPWSSPGLMWRLFEPEKSHATLTGINSAELMTDWGARSISAKSQYYEPLNYNYGAVWPFLTSFVSTAQFVNHFAEAGYATLLSTVRHTFDNSLGNITEVFSGQRNVWPAEAVSHQGFSSAGVVLPLVRGLLGLVVDGAEGKVTFAPHLPADWHHIEVGNLIVGPSKVNFVLSKDEKSLNLSIRVTGARPVSLLFSPAFQSGEVTGVLLNGEAAPYEISETSQDFHVMINAEIQQEANIRIDRTPSFEVVFPQVDCRTGDANRGLKVIETQRLGRDLKYVLEGLSGETYLLKVLNPDYILRITGGKLVGKGIEISLPDDSPGEFVRWSLKIEGKR